MYQYRNPFFHLDIVIVFNTGLLCVNNQFFYFIAIHFFFSHICFIYICKCVRHILYPLYKRQQFFCKLALWLNIQKWGLFITNCMYMCVSVSTTSSEYFEVDAFFQTKLSNQLLTTEMVTLTFQQFYVTFIDRYLTCLQKAYQRRL